MTNSTLSRTSPRGGRQNPVGAERNLYDVLSALGFRSTERISVNTKTRDGRFSSRLCQVSELADWLAPTDRDVWFGANPISASVVRGRGTDGDVTRVRVLFADLDVKDGGLETMDECREVVDKLARILGTPPAVVVESGHGIQPYWRLTSPRVASTRIADESETATERWSRQTWREVYARWGGLIHQVAQEVRPGARIDNVYDLSRVLRCPGSVNHKAAPVSVITHLYDSARSLNRDQLLDVLDDREAAPLGGAVGPRSVRVPTGWADAEAWVNAQPGAGADLDSMSPYLRRKFNYGDLVVEFVRGTDDERSAHNLMRNRVNHVVLSSTEGNAGLALCLNLVCAAYLEVMERRRAGEVAGEARSESVALGDFKRAVLGAVSVARGRHNSPMPLRDSSGSIYIRTTQGA